MKRKSMNYGPEALLLPLTISDYDEKWASEKEIYIMNVKWYTHMETKDIFNGLKHQIMSICMNTPVLNMRIFLQCKLQLCQGILMTT